MPQLALVVLAGAGIYAGLKWVAKTLERQGQLARLQAEELRARERSRAAKDLGTLEYDPENRVYKPSTPRGA